MDSNSTHRQLNHFDPGTPKSRAERLAAAALGSAAILLGAVGPIQAAALNWNAVFGGSAGLSGNWTPAQLPTAADDLTFNLNATFGVSFPAGISTAHSQTYRRGHVTITLAAPHTVTNGFTVGNVSGDVGDLTLGSGSLISNANLDVANAAGSSGILTVDGSDATVDIVGATSDLVVGANGTGTLEVLGGGEINVDDDFLLGAGATGNGTATISGGSGSFPNLFRSNVHTVSGTTGDITIGSNGDGSVTLSNGGVLNAGRDIRMALSAASTSTIDVSGSFSFFPSSIIAGRNLDISRNDSVNAAGTSTLTLNSGTTAVVHGQTRIGDSAGGNGVLQLNGGQISSDGGIDIQTSGRIIGTGTINADITNLGTIQPTGANGLEINGILTNNTNNIFGTRVFFGATGGYTGSGLCNAEIAGDTGATITATGTLLLGQNSVAGVSYGGTLDVGNHLVFLQDSNGAVLAGLTKIDGGTLQCGPGIGVALGGSITGQGQLQGNTIISGGLDPHSDTSSGGTISITGTFTMNPTGIIDMEIGGPPASSANDRVNITSTASFGGSVRVRLKNGYVPHVGEQFIVANATLGRTGEFATLISPTGGQAPCNDVTFVLVYSSTAAIVLVRPPLGCTALGDLNSDGQHDAKDIQPFVNALLNPSYNACADMNGDCEDDANDIPIFLNARL